MDNEDTMKEHHSQVIIEELKLSKKVVIDESQLSIYC